jgi:hypothetical protein
MATGKWILLWGPFVAAAVGCSPLSETTAFYTPASGRYYPPLPKNAPVEVLSESPRWPHEVIGRFAAESDRGYPFLYRALLYNARLQGADAVVLRKLSFEDRTTYDTIPAHWENVPQTNVVYQQVRNSEGQWVTVPQVYTVMVPVFRPEQTLVREARWADLQADLMVRRGKPAVAPLPAQIEMPRN